MEENCYVLIWFYYQATIRLYTIDTEKKKNNKHQWQDISSYLTFWSKYWLHGVMAVEKMTPYIDWFPINLASTMLFGLSPGWILPLKTKIALQQKEVCLPLHNLHRKGHWFTWSLSSYNSGTTGKLCFTTCQTGILPIVWAVDCQRLLPGH